VNPLRLRVDVCTYQGLRDGVPEILRILRRRRARATFFVAFGPDSSGRAVFNLLKPAFARKMFRTNAAASYGLATALYGTVLPAPLIGSGRPSALRRILDDGHELGVHGWDHRRWQDDLDEYAPARLASEFNRMCEAFESVAGRPPAAFAAPAWRASPRLLALEEKRGFSYASDARGFRPFVPEFEGRTYGVPQVPVTLPTLDECLGAMTAADFGAEILRRSAAQPEYCCLAVHAETEGRAHRRVLEEILSRIGRTVEPLGAEPRAKLPAMRMAMANIPGRPYPVCVQQDGAPRPP
jgi:peptidoglycan/xylan/chitin deacetylase (PgdA/CDA1 family)